MVHPATLRAIKTAVEALGVQLDIGAVFPPREGHDRGHGIWQKQDLGLKEILDLAPRLAGQNARGAHIFMRLGPAASAAHPGLVLIDDLDAASTRQLDETSMEPCLIIETSPGNHQAWIRLVSEGSVAYSTMNTASRHLAALFAGDLRATSPRQPGRLPGFTNQKPKYRRNDGTSPFVRIIAARPGAIASRGRDLINALPKDTVGRAAAGRPKRRTRRNGDTLKIRQKPIHRATTA